MKDIKPGDFDTVRKALKFYYPQATDAEIDTMVNKVKRQTTNPPRAAEKPPAYAGGAHYEPTWRDDLADGVKEFKDTMKRDKQKRDAALEERTRPEVVMAILGCLFGIVASGARLKREVSQLRRM